MNKKCKICGKGKEEHSVNLVCFTERNYEIGGKPANVHKLTMFTR